MPLHRSLASASLLFICSAAISLRPLETLPAAESHDFGLVLESPLIPDLDASSTISGQAGDSVQFTIVMDLGTAASESATVQGWSYGVWIAGFEIDSISTEGTITDLKVRGGIRDADAGFISFLIIDPEANEGKSGVVQAFIPSLVSNVLLPLKHRYRIGKINGTARIDAQGRLGFARYEPHLVGTGQPVRIALTAGGETVTAAIEHRDFIIGRAPPPETCEDGIDNDRNGWTDAEDPNCRAPLLRENCDDGEDNDSDGAVDCEDSECFADPPCPQLEICGDGLDNDGNGDADCSDPACIDHPFCLAREDCEDGVDNDNDGLADCRDRDCGGIPPCPVIERCLDGIENEGDGLVDCDDPDCAGTIFCGFFEACSDGEDNNGDGLVDCEDPQCAQGPTCGETEDCEDGVDNDDDGLIDCDDNQCRGVGPCPGPERCGDGRDNDQDGFTDCDDISCRQSPLCIDPEVCDDGLDNDADGFIDCEDSQCRGRGDCPGPEICDDGLDNDRDGLADCADPECVTRARCRQENCSDGFDNDIDGLVDCDDSECRGREGCPVEFCDNGLDDDEDGLADCEDPACWYRSPCSGGESGFDFVLAAVGAVREKRADGGAAGLPVGPPADTGVDTLNVLEVSYTSTTVLEVVTYIVPFPVAQTRGIQGWSVSISHDPSLLSVVGAPTIDGTDAGDLFSGGFEKTETVGDQAGAGAGTPGGDGNDGDAGVVSAVVLAFTQPTVLDPSIAQSVLRTTYELSPEIGLAGAGTPVIRFKDGLRGSGQAVSNTMTIAGAAATPVHLVPLQIRRVGLFAPFIRGDVNTDGDVDIADAVWALSELMRGGPLSPCPSATDVNDDGLFNVADPIFLLQYEFLNGPTIPAPFPACGRDSEELNLPCVEGVAPHCT